MSAAHGHTTAGEVRLRLPDRVLAVMEDRGDQGCIGPTRREPVIEVSERAGATGGDHRDAHPAGDRARQLEVVAELGAVAIHAREQDLTCTRGLHLYRPGHGVEAGRRPAAVGEDLPAPSRVVGDSPAGIDRHHNALGAEAFGGLADEGGTGHRSGVDRHLVRTGAQELADVVDGTNAAPDGERHEDPLGGARHHVEDDGARLVGGGDVEEAELVSPLRVVASGDLDRVAGVGEVDEAYPLHHPPTLDVETRDDAAGEHRYASATTASAAARSTAPV